jgi:hypothetical protein
MTFQERAGVSDRRALAVCWAWQVRLNDFHRFQWRKDDFLTNAAIQADRHEYRGMCRPGSAFTLLHASNDSNPPLAALLD